MWLVNSRPLTHIYLHDGELDPLTPNHLIIVRPNVRPPPGYLYHWMYMHVRVVERFKDWHNIFGKDGKITISLICRGTEMERMSPRYAMWRHCTHE